VKANGLGFIKTLSSSEGVIQDLIDARDSWKQNVLIGSYVQQGRSFRRYAGSIDALCIVPSSEYWTSARKCGIVPLLISWKESERKRVMLHQRRRPITIFPLALAK
jgi:hypothetical protein